jgi:hypothetical protein
MYRQLRVVLGILAAAAAMSAAACSKNPFETSTGFAAPTDRCTVGGEIPPEGCEVSTIE